MNKIFFSIILIFVILFNQILRLSANDDTYINSKNIIYNEKDNVVELSENSKINFKNTNILIDQGIIDYNKNEFEVFGNFYLYEGLTILSGQDLKGNTSLDIFNANNVSYLYNNDLKIDSENLVRDKNYIYFYNNFLTPCELEGFFNCPTWSLRIDKTEYNIEKDKYTHFDTFLQIADYKVFYLPYFSHYGGKAPRQRGFLTPSFEFTIGGNQGLITPYYFPIDESLDITFKPKIFFNQNFEFLENYQLNTHIEKKSSGGNSSVHIENIKNTDNTNINSTFRIKTKNIVNKNRIISASGLFTNSISTTRSNNDDPITFEDLYFRLENYDLFFEKDYLKTELSSVKTFESSSILSSIPISPSINYYNEFTIKDKSFINNLDFIILKRNESTVTAPSESVKLSLSNEVIKNKSKFFINSYNKLTFSNSINNYYFNHNQNLNRDSFKSSLILSSDNFYNKSMISSPRIKLILPIELSETEDENEINEDSNSITFNYINQFSDNRFFGSDLLDNSPRLVYGIESDFNVFDETPLSIKLNQSYDFNPNNKFLSKINQNTYLSDFAIEVMTEIKKINLKIDSRLDSKNLSRKEMNYSIDIDDPLKVSIRYYETQSEAFKNLSKNSQSLSIGISKQYNDNFFLGFNSSMDVKNNYNPYENIFKIGLSDECSQLELTYTNTRYNDNYNTQPKEIIGITYRMDYLGFFGYEQSTDLFFSKPGNVNYGL